MFLVIYPADDGTAGAFSVTRGVGEVYTTWLAQTITSKRGILSSVPVEAMIDEWSTVELMLKYINDARSWVSAPPALYAAGRRAPTRGDVFSCPMLLRRSMMLRKAISCVDWPM